MSAVPEVSFAGAVIAQAQRDLALPLRMKCVLAEVRARGCQARRRRDMARAYEQSIGYARSSARFLLRDLWEPGNLWGALIGESIPRHLLRKEVLAALARLRAEGIDTGLRIRPAGCAARRAHRSHLIRPDIRARFDRIAARA